jgi:acetyltransferase-like isoleucine patch superfamily enzyme
VNDVFVHPTALVASRSIGAGTRVWAFSNVLEGAVVGADCNIGDHCFVEGGAVVGDGVTIKNGTSVWEGVTLEDGAFVGPAVRFTNDLWPRSPRLPEAATRYAGRDWLVPTRVGRGASLGAGAVIVCGVEIGEFALVAAGAVVTRDVPPFALVAGNPARTRGWVCRCGARLVFAAEAAVCVTCGGAFELTEGVASPAASDGELTVPGSARGSRGC